MTGINNTGDKWEKIWDRKFFLIVSGADDTGEQHITVVNDTGDKHKVANISANSRKNSKWPQWGTEGPEENVLIKNLKTKISCQTPFNIIQTTMTLNILGMFVQCLVSATHL